MLLPATVLTGCDKDEPEVTVPDEPNNGSNDKDDDDNEKPGDEKPDVPDESGEKKVTVNADGTTSDGSHFRRINETTFMLNYVKYSICDGHIEVTGCDNTEIGLSLNGKVDLYSTIVINNVSYKVRVIGARAFSDCNSLIEINIPNSVSSIKECAFVCCIHLTTVTIPDSVVEIDLNVFYGCASLSEVRLPNLVLSVFHPSDLNSSSSLIHIDVPEGVKDLTGASIFGCDNIASISLPSTLEHFDTRFWGEQTYRMKYIYFKSLVPPPSNGNNFDFRNHVTIFISEGKTLYYRSRWSNFAYEIIGVNPETFDFVQYLKDKGVYDR